MADNKSTNTSSIPTLQAEEGAVLLDVVDQLRDLGNITHELSLPQIVVVGDQSSGKSSVLEAISGLSFPTNEELCTQFATEVVLRRSKTSKTTISIKSTNDDRKQATKDFSEKWKDANLQQLENMVEEAKSVMGLSEQNRFSEDLLRLEVCGPDQDHLTLVDLPGLFQNTEINQSPRDRDLVRKLVTRYIAKPRTIVLAILSCSSDYQVQGILDLLKSIDKSGERTLGIVTMPDMLTEGTPRFMAFKALIDNRRWPLRLGWHVLRNPNFTEKRDPKCDRRKIENAFFEQHSWSNVPPVNRGALALQKRLSELLTAHISKELPEILDDITDAIKRCEAEKDRLGSERDTPEKQRNYLMDIGEKFKHLMSCALEGEYSDSYFDAEHHRLRALIMNSNEIYAKTMTNFGHRWQLKDTDGSGRSPQLLFAVAPKHFALKAAAPELIEHNKLVEQVMLMQQSYRGLELPGLPQPRLVGKLFKQQSKNWRNITEVHVDHVFAVTKQFIEDLLTHAAGGKTSAAILSEIVDPELESREKTLRRKIGEVLKPYTNERPLTLNTSYLANLKIKSEAHVTPGLRASLTPHTDGEIQSCQKIIESMQAYYDIALNVLLDNVALLVIEHCLLDDLHQTISPRSMQKLPSSQLERLAGEAHDVTARRHVLDQMLEEYRRGHRLIRAYSRRPLRTANIEWPQSARASEALNNGSALAAVEKPLFNVLGSQQSLGLASDTQIEASTKPVASPRASIFDNPSWEPYKGSKTVKAASNAVEGEESFFGSVPPSNSVFDHNLSTVAVAQRGTVSSHPVTPSRSTLVPKSVRRSVSPSSGLFGGTGAASTTATSCG